MKGSQSINDLSSFPDSSPSPGSTGTLPRSSRGKIEDTCTPEDTCPTDVSPPGMDVVTRRTGNRNPRPHSLYISALENCMTKDDTKDGDGEGFIEAEVVSPVKDTKTPNTRANDDLPGLKSSKDKKHGILDFVSFYSFVLSALIFYLGVSISNKSHECKSYGLF